MKRNFLLVCLLSFVFNLQAQLTTGSIPYAGAPGGRIYFYQYKPPQYNTSSSLPLIVSLHGGGEEGPADGSVLSRVITYGLPQIVAQGGVLQATYQNVTEGFVMVAPQAATGLSGNWPTYYVDQMIDYAIQNLKADPNRVFLTGYSNGGNGVWKYATSSAAAASRLAGLIPAAAVAVSGGTNFCNIAQNKVATWVQHAYHDEYGNVQEAIDYTNAINACSPVVPAVDTIYEFGSHNIYMFRTYELTNTYQYPNLFQWMLKVNRNLNPSTNQNPVPVIAGPSTVTLTAPLNKRNLPVLDGSGSYDPDDIIMNYLWEQTGGPVNLLPAPADRTQIDVDQRRQWPVVSIPVTPTNYGVPVGTYTFRLRVKDYLTSKPGHTQFATKTINVVLPPVGAGPVADAGDDIILSGNATSAQRSGSFENTYGTGSNIQYNWTIVSGPPGAQLRTFNGSAPYTAGDNNVMFSNLVNPGTYVFQFSISNTAGSSTDQVSVIKLATLPVSYAYITGSNIGTANVINWSTSTEVNSDRFDIQRSTDGTNFTVIGSVSARGGTNATDYSFEDVNAPLGISYYRLLQVDKDGKSSLSKVVSVNNRRSGLVIEKYPNPVHDNLTVTLKGTITGKMQVLIADMQGKTMMQQQWQKDMPQLKKVINVGALQNGVYQMIIISGSDKMISSFVKY
ncbi:MAG TPA: T9SS type A sorting domain-containing protein [Chitinophagaceae bacterium]|nr:T9SS type A sorting domain-containing protein [Chitinophagaceae bacterium]